MSANWLWLHRSSNDALQFLKRNKYTGYLLDEIEKELENVIEEERKEDIQVQGAQYVENNVPLKWEKDLNEEQMEGSGNGSSSS